MKIRYDIQEKYTETELHLCGSKKTAELTELHLFLSGILDMQFRVHKEQEYKTLVPSEMVRIYSENKKVYVRTVDDCYEVGERLYILEEQLKDRGFVRISNSEIVNIRRIEKLDMSSAGTIKMYLKNGDVTYVSRRFVKKIKEVLM